MAQETSPLKADIDSECDAVLAQMTALRDKMAKLAHRVSASISTRRHAMTKDVTGSMSNAADMRIAGAIATNPYIVLGLAAGMGLLLGAMARR